MKNNSRQLLFAGIACCFAVYREGRKIKTGPKSVTKTEKETSILDELASLFDGAGNGNRTHLLSLEG